MRICFFFGTTAPPPVGHDLLIHEVSRSHTTTHHSRYDFSGRVIRSSQRPLPDNTQHWHQTHIHACGGIQTHNLSRWAAADLCLRPCGHWDRKLYVRGICYWLLKATGKSHLKKTCFNFCRFYVLHSVFYSEWGADVEVIFWKWKQ